MNPEAKNLADKLYKTAFGRARQTVQEPTAECSMCGEWITGSLKDWYFNHRCKGTKGTP